jgi:mRNA-degrading endonuclease RelE of RelBE toxin-antitoxin system
MYNIEFSKSSRDFLKKIPKQDAEIILRKIYELRENPFRSLKRLEGFKLWRLRIMKYRAIIDVIVSGNKIMVVRIGYRKNVYEKI